MTLGNLAHSEQSEAETIEPGALPRLSKKPVRQQKGIRGLITELSTSRMFRLLAGLTAVTVVEAISYAWIEVLLFTSDSPYLRNLWILGHYTTYHVVLGILVSAMIFGVGFFGATIFIPRAFRRFLLAATGDFLLWILLEDEFFFIFSGSSHTPSDWTSQFLGTISAFGNYIPTWYLVAAAAVFICWTLALRSPD